MQKGSGMDHFYIITNSAKDIHLQATETIMNYLESRGKTVVRSDTGEDENRDFRYTDYRRIPEDTEGILVLGGDGTLLQAARDLHGLEIPLLGINLGTLGYLAEIELSGVSKALDCLIEDRYSVEKRMMIDGVVIHKDQEILKDSSLNDIVIVRKGPLRIMDFDIYVNDAFLCSLRADGIIMSTPTGSTGYSLSAGGPIVAPDASMILLTAIAPHTLSSRPIVLPDNVKITVQTGRDKDNRGGIAVAAFDGDLEMEVRAGDRIEVCRSSKSASLIKIQNTSFVEILRRKMN